MPMRALLVIRMSNDRSKLKKRAKQERDKRKELRKWVEREYGHLWSVGS